MTPNSERPDASSALLFFSDSLSRHLRVCVVSRPVLPTEVSRTQAAGLGHCLPAFLTKEALFIGVSKRTRDRSFSRGISPPTLPD